MNAQQAKLKEKMDRLTQRLDRKLPDARLSQEENDRAADELFALCDLVHEMFPQPCFGPEEKLIRAAVLLRLGPLSRTIDDTDVARLARVKALIDEIVPGDASPEEKIRQLQKEMAPLLPELLPSLAAV